MNKILKMISAAMALTLLSGCVPHTELNEKAIILAIGIDYEDEIYKVCFQYYNPSGTGSKTLVDNSKPNVLTAKGEGESVFAALEDASFRSGKELMLGVTQLIVIGEEAIKYSVDQVMSFTKSYFQSHPDMLVVVSEGNARDYMQVKFTEGTVSTQKLQFMLQNANKNGNIALPSALDLFIALQTELRSTCLPRLRLLKGEGEEEKADVSEDGKNIEICGGVLIKDGKAVAQTDIEVMSGLEMLRSKTEKGAVTVDYNGKKLSVGMVNIKTKMYPHLENGKLVFDVKITAKGRYMEDPNSGTEDYDNDEINQKCCEELIGRLDRTVRETVNKYGADPCIFEKTIRHYDNKLWNEIKDNYEEMLKNCSFNFDADIEIDKLILTK